jgi:CheY-like chemotaxis protein
MSEFEDKVVVVVADDEPSTLALVASLVRSKGYQVSEASDGDQAWQLAQALLPHLVILDVMMPGMSGWEVCRKIRESPALAHTGVIMLTGIGENLNDMTSPLYGADAYLDKPFEFAVLDAKVEKTLLERAEGALGRPAAEGTARKPTRRPAAPGSNGMAAPVSPAKAPQKLASPRGVQAPTANPKAAAGKSGATSAKAATAPRLPAAKTGKAAAKPSSATATKAKPKAVAVAKGKPKAAAKTATKPKAATKTAAKPKAATKTATKPKAATKAAARPKAATKTAARPKAATKAAARPKAAAKTTAKPKVAARTPGKPKAAAKAVAALASKPIGRAKAAPVRALGAPKVAAPKAARKSAASTPAARKRGGSAGSATV